VTDDEFEAAGISQAVEEWGEARFAPVASFVG
jgi:hypothetical protein